MNISKRANPLFSRFFGIGVLTTTLCVSVSSPAKGLTAYDNLHNNDVRMVQHIAQPKIQMAILLDTSSSMNGLIDQARNQLWAAVNEFANARRNGVSPLLEVAVIEYGNSRLAKQNGYTRQVVGFTRELDQVSEALFALTTGGGSEYCGYVIDKAVTKLNWSNSDQDIKAIFIAGNEPFTQGPVSYRTAIRAAIDKGVTVNTIFAGQHNVGARSGWQDGALLAQGNYMSINHNHRIVHIEAPQDKQIAALNKQLNETYIPYGAQGPQAVVRQQKQDAQSSDISIGLLAQRIQSKVGGMYRNESWDLVDALETGATSLKGLDDEALPSEMKSMSEKERRDYVARKTEKRKVLQEEIVKLTKARNQHVAEKRQAAKPDVTTLNDAIIAAVRSEAKKKLFVFGDN